MTHRTNEQEMLAGRALRAVFELAQQDRSADAGAVAQVLGLSRARAAELLLRLDAQGLLVAARCRLTMRGLAVAARLAPVHCSAVNAEAARRLSRVA